jgi:hypothetical protein
MNLRCTILHLEDDDNDSLFFEWALSRLGFAGEYRRVSEFTDVIEYLSGNGIYEDRNAFPLPNILVLDNVLAGGKLTNWIESHPKFCSLSRVILTGGMAQAESQKWLARGIHSILQKGGSIDDMTVSARKILETAAL